MKSRTEAEEPKDQSVDEVVSLDEEAVTESSTDEKTGKDEKVDQEPVKDEVKEATTDTKPDNQPKLPWYKKFIKNKKVAIPAAILLFWVILFLIPQTRYPILGLFWKQDYSVKVVDSQTNQPVTATTISLAGQTAKTDNHGSAKLHVKVGYHNITISKKYYSTLSSKVVVPLHQKAAQTFTVTATGRQVPVTVLNKISGKPVSNATVKSGDSEVQTDSQGQGTIVLPPNKTTVSATISADGFNDNTATVQVTSQTVAQNTFQLTPAGKVYFLSKLSGKIDVVKTNLDGSDRQTVLAGTGFEDNRNTVLLASRDWKYLALNSIRGSGDKSQLNLIDTTNGDKLVNIDTGDATFESVGWANNNFVYLVERNNYAPGQSGAESIKSYNPQTGKITTLDSTTASGTNGNDQQYENMYASNITIMGNQVIYFKTWYAGLGYLTVPGRQNTFNTVGADGSNKKVIGSVDAGNSYYSTLIKYQPQEVLVRVDGIQKQSSAYYAYTSDGTYKQTTDSDDIAAFSNAYPTYLLSPSGNQNFWAVQADGKNSLFIGDQNGENKKQVLSLSDYTVFGWYTDDYLLVSKNASELYIMPLNGSPVLKVTDYHKPALNFAGYGGGYGGL